MIRVGDESPGPQRRGHRQSSRHRPGVPNHRSRSPARLCGWCGACAVAPAAGADDCAAKAKFNLRCALLGDTASDTLGYCFDRPGVLGTRWQGFAPYEGSTDGQAGAANAGNGVVATAELVGRSHIEHPKYNISCVTLRAGIIAIAGTLLCPINRSLQVLASSAWARQARTDSRWAAVVCLGHPAALPSFNSQRPIGNCPRQVNWGTCTPRKSSLHVPTTSCGLSDPSCVRSRTYWFLRV
jgi:hypothetical protein